MTNRKASPRRRPITHHQKVVVRLLYLKGQPWAVRPGTGDVLVGRGYARFVSHGRYTLTAKGRKYYEDLG